MNLGIRKKSAEGSVANFQQIAQAFWSKPDASKSPAKEPRPESSKVKYVGGLFKGTYTNKEIEGNQKIVTTGNDPEKKSDISYERYFK